MNKCAHCGGHVPKRYRRALALDSRNTPKKAKAGAKTFYHYACVEWKRRSMRRSYRRVRSKEIVKDLTSLLNSFQDCYIGEADTRLVLRFLKKRGYGLR